MFFEDDVIVVVVEEDGDGAQLCGCATCFRDFIRLQQMDHLLNEGVVGGVHTGAQRIKTLPVAVIGRVSIGRQHPVLPAQVVEADVELMFFTGLAVVHRSVIVNAGNWEVVFGLLPSGLGSGGARRSTRDLTFSEEGHHEGLFGARPPASHQPDPSRRQRAVLLCLHVQPDAQVAPGVKEPVVGG